MRHHWIIALFIVAYNGLLLGGLWYWEWPAGNLYALLLAEGVLIALLTFLELLRAGVRNSSEGVAVVLGFVQAVLLVAALAASAVFAAYYSWIVGIDPSRSPMTWLLLALVVRYVIEWGVRTVSHPAAPSVMLHRGWLRGVAIALGITVSGLGGLVFLMSTFPFELPYPGDQLFRLPPYLEGIAPMVDHVVGAASLSLLVVVKAAFELQSVWGRTRGQVRHLAWADQLLKSHQQQEVSESLLGPDQRNV